MTYAPINTADLAASPDELHRLYRAWKYAAAQWEVASNDPAKPEGLSPDEAAPYSEAEHAALLAFFAHPANNLEDIVLKLSVFQSEEAWEYRQVREIVNRVYDDLRTVAFGPWRGEASLRPVQRQNAHIGH